MGNSNLKWEELESKIANASNEEDEIYESEEILEEEEPKVKKKREKIKKENNNKKNILPIIIIGIVLFVLLIISTIFALANINNKNIVSGVKIEGIDVSRLSKEEAKEKIDLIYNEKKQKDILLKYEDYDATINPELIETNYNTESAIEEAISIGKSSNIIVNNYNILLALIGQKNIEINMTINEEEIKKTIENIGSNIPGSVVEPDYYREEDKLIITKGKEGLKVDTENLIEKIKKNLKKVNSNEEYIKIPVINKKPEQIDIEKIHEEVYKEVQDAYYTKEPFAIHPEVEGVDFNVEEAKALLQEDKEQYEIPLTITKPKITTSQIGSEAFPDLLGTYSTKYDASIIDRSTNLKIACQKINDKVILPGETFSYNQTLGERTAAAGYKNAKVYENGEVVDGIGGGICQISSTLYNSVLKANMEVTERRNHQFVTSYTPAGRDATVVYGMTDFKFKNTRTYAIKIKATCSNGIATVSIYGIKEENEYTVSFNTKTISTIPYTVKYVDDSTLPAGTEKVKQVGANGMITETYIIKSLNGKVVSSKLLSKDTYNAMQRIILRGTKGSSNNTNTSNNKPTAPAEPVEPTTPTTPAEPTEPTTPTNPVGPTEPSNSIPDENPSESNPEESGSEGNNPQEGTEVVNEAISGENV